MKWLVLIICSCFLLIPKTIRGQKGFSFGIDLSVRHTGFTSWTNFNPFKEATLRPTFGISVDYRFNEWAGIRSGMSLHFYSHKMIQSQNNFTYLGFPIQVYIHPGIQHRTKDIPRTIRPTFQLGFRPLVLLQAEHKTTESVEDIKRFTESFRYEMTGGIGLLVRINDQLLLENVVFADLGNPFNSLEHNNTQGAIVNFNLGFKAGLAYGLNSNKDP